MQLALLLYLAAIADNLRSSMQLFIFASAIVGGISLVVVLVTFGHLEGSEEVQSADFQDCIQANRLARKIGLTSLYVWVALLFFSHLVPSRNDVYVIAGGYVALKAANNEVVQNTANSVLNSIEHWLEKESATSEEKKNNAKKGDK